MEEILVALYKKLNVLSYYLPTILANMLNLFRQRVKI
jgi:hypothetical protein